MTARCACLHEMHRGHCGITTGAPVDPGWPCPCPDGAVVDEAMCRCGHRESAHVVKYDGHGWLAGRCIRDHEARACHRFARPSSQASLGL